MHGNDTSTKLSFKLFSLPPLIPLTKQSVKVLNICKGERCRCIAISDYVLILIIVKNAIWQVQWID